MDYKVLINKDNKITSQFLNSVNLIMVKNYLNEDVLIEKKTYNKFVMLKNFLEEMGVLIFIKSAYMSPDDDEKLFNEGDECEVNTGFSEHHTGLCIDFILKKDGKFLTSKEEVFDNIDMFEIVHKYLGDYGFILRYPPLKEEVVGFTYIPWHIRYVGFHTANIITKNNLTLEEYHQKYNVSGVLVINKPAGLTSRDVDSLIGRKFDTKKVGHTGTLDPLASGVLIVLLNKATKICNEIVTNDKEYIATVKRGIETDTLDIDGRVVRTSKVNKDVNLNEVLESFVKTYLQEVPVYSAVKVNGKKLYQYARSGDSVVLPKKEVTIKKIELLEEDGDIFKFKCLVSKGTYIRSLIRDIGNNINECMTMLNLVRVREGDFKIDDSFSIDDIKKDNYEIIPIERVLNYKVVSVSSELFFKIKNGVSIDNSYNILDKVIFKYGEMVVAIYQVSDDRRILKCYKNFC